MPRYIKQRDYYSCAPVAFVNLLKWAGIKRFRGKDVNYSLVKSRYLKRKLKIDKGVKILDFANFLYSLKEFKVVTKINIKKKQIDKCLQNGGCVLASINVDASLIKKDEEPELHITMICKEKDGYLVTNFCKKHMFISKRNLKTLFNFFKPDVFSWEIYENSSS